MLLTLAHEFATLLGMLAIAPTGHGAVLFQMNGLTIYVDPYSETTDYTGYPKADIIFFTHDHGDHYDPRALKHLVTDKTQFVGPECMKQHIKNVQVMAQGDTMSWHGITIKSVPAYNLINKRPDGTPFHPKGFGTGYVFTFGDLVVYLAGDTELIPEMNEMGHVDIAILPKNLPYTMSDAQFVEAVKCIKAPIVYPVHYFELDKAALEKAVGPDVTLYYE